MSWSPTVKATVDANGYRVSIWNVTSAKGDTMEDAEDMLILNLLNILIMLKHGDVHHSSGVPVSGEILTWLLGLGDYAASGGDIRLPVFEGRYA